MTEKVRKEYYPFSCRMNAEIYAKLEKLCQDSGMTKTSAVERAINMYVEDYEKKQKLLENLK